MLDYEGCNWLRLRLTLSLFSGKPVRIRNIRPNSENPGLKEFEISLIKLLDSIANGNKVEINKTGTELVFFPGLLTGGRVELDCGRERCLSYFLQVLLFLGPFCKTAIKAKLFGITDKRDEVSVECFRVSWLPVMKQFLVNDENLEIKISKRGLLPEGGGEITFSCPTANKLKAVTVEKQGKIKKIRGTAFACKVSPILMSRMIESAKETLKGYISDIYITADHKKGAQGGNSPGYGITLHAETTEGVVFVGEAVSTPRGEDAVTPEDVGQLAATQLLDDIYRGGCSSSSAQPLVCLYMSLGQFDVSKFVVASLSQQCVDTLRHLKDTLDLQFKLDKYRISGTKNEDLEENCRFGEEEKVLLTCVGIGFKNLAKNVM